ncbi:MAG: sigma-70 family RNA polymerase sigma factor [Solirubrobacteraceae bacterium]|nr:sigma-70 family RNA polymerase sigma factor [Solirubrobacteraceae bacterium]
MDLEPIYRETVPLVMRLAAFHGLDPDDAADVAGHTYLVAFEKLEHFDPSLGTAVGWVLGIANNVLRQHASSQARGRRLIERTAFQRPALTERDVSEYSQLRSDTRELLKAIAELPSSERSLLLARLDGTPYADLAAADRTSAQALRQRLHRTTASLRAALLTKGD